MRDMSRLATLAPVNRTAGMVVGPGDPRHECTFNPIVYRSDSPSMRIVPFTGPADMDLSGVKIGRWRVVGYLGKAKQWSHKTGRWLVKCDCGAYELRTSKSLRNPDAVQMCQGCAYTEKIKRGEVKK